MTTRTVSPRLFALLALVSCVGKPAEEPYYPCPDEKYTPAGFVIESYDECPEDRCVLICDPTVCDGTLDTYCESCEDIQAYVEGPCAECRREGPGHPVYWPSCDPPWGAR